MAEKSDKIQALTIGSLMVDTIAVIDERDIERVTMHNATASFLMLEQGKKIDAENISTHVGGGAANVAVSLSRFGFSVDVLAVIGDDLNANKILRHMCEEGVGAGYIRKSATEDTGTSVLVSSHDQNAAIFTHRGANGRLTAAQIAGISFDRYNLVYIASLSNESADQFSNIVERAKKSGCFVVANPGIRQLTLRWEDMKSCLGSIDLLAINEAEAIALVSALGATRPDCHAKLVGGIADTLPPLLQKGLQSNGISCPLPDLLLAIRNMGTENILVTDGKNGAYLFDGETLFYLPANQIVPKGTAGAGDAFISTFSAAYIARWGTERALCAATLNAASVVSHIDTQTGLMQYADLQSGCDQNETLSEPCRWTLKNKTD